MVESNSTQISFQWVVTNSKVDEFVSRLEDQGATIIEEKKNYVPSLGDSSFEPLLLIKGTILLVTLAKEIVSLHKKIKKGGIIIDTRRDPPLIREERTLEYGYIILIDADGETKLQKPAENKLLVLLRKLM